MNSDEYENSAAESEEQEKSDDEEDVDDGKTGPQNQAQFDEVPVGGQCSCLDIHYIYIYY